MITRTFAILLFVGCASAIPRAGADEPPVRATRAVANALEPLVATDVGGVLGQRLTLWRTKRLWRVAEDPFLLNGFEHPPGKHPWQGEHVGKWLHAATLAEEATQDPRLDAEVRRVAAALMATQAPNGYLGTYAEPERFYRQVPQGNATTWDIWTHRYTLYGLLRYDELHAAPGVITACDKEADLLAATFGPPAGDITRFGTRHGLSSAVLLESVVLLYERTGQRRYLDFARHLVDSVEENPQLRLGAAMRAGEDVTVCGDGKAYQLMSLLLGYVEMYRATGEKPFLETALTAWQKIRDGHINLAGGPWSYQAAPATNQECFAPTAYFHPTCCIETCSTTTWIQLNLALFELTAEARFADEAERALVNQLIGAQSPNGNDWAYHSMLNMPNRGYEDEITCCASSGPRALEVYAQHLACASKDGVVINSYFPAQVPLGTAGTRAGRLIVTGNYPLEPGCTLRWQLTAPTKLAVDFRLPTGATGMTVLLNGEPQPLERTPSGARLSRIWRDGDQVELKFDFALRAHFQTASDGLRWVGFTWGPLALAQTLAVQTDVPEYVLNVKQESTDGGAWLTRDAGRAARVADNAAEEGPSANRTSASATKVPTWRLKAPRRIILVPYYLAGAEGGGVRTMWPTRNTPQ